MPRNLAIAPDVAALLPAEERQRLAGDPTLTHVTCTVCRVEERIDSGVALAVHLDLLGPQLTHLTFTHRDCAPSRVTRSGALADAVDVGDYPDVTTQYVCFLRPRAPHAGFMFETVARATWRESDTAEATDALLAAALGAGLALMDRPFGSYTPTPTPGLTIGVARGRISLRTDAYPGDAGELCDGDLAGAPDGWYQALRHDRAAAVIAGTGLGLEHFTVEGLNLAIARGQVAAGIAAYRTTANGHAAAGGQRR